VPYEMQYIASTSYPISTMSFSATSQTFSTVVAADAVDQNRPYIENYSRTKILDIVQPTTNVQYLELVENNVYSKSAHLV
jgi:hypothetical protein